MSKCPECKNHMMYMEGEITLYAKTAPGISQDCKPLEQEVKGEYCNVCGIMNSYTIDEVICIDCKLTELDLKAVGPMINVRGGTIKELELKAEEKPACDVCGADNHSNKTFCFDCFEKADDIKKYFGNKDNHE